MQLKNVYLHEYLCNHHPHQGIKLYFRVLRSTLDTPSQSLTTPASYKGNHFSDFHLHWLVLSVPVLQINGIIQHTRVYLLRSVTRSAVFIHTVAATSSSSFLNYYALFYYMNIQRLPYDKRKELLTHAATWMNLKNNLSERNHSQKIIYCTIPFK